MFKKSICVSVTLAFLCSLLTPVPKAQAQSLLGLPEPGTLVSLSPAYQPAIIKGLTIHKDNPFLFDFIVDVGQDQLQGQALKNESEKLIKYFLASLAIPEKDLWVNLSPYEKNRIVPQALGQTDMGRDLLAEDYMLKQITASLIYPEKDLGKDFWNKVFTAARTQFGTTAIPLNTFNKVWIMADKAEVYEHDQTVFVISCHLKVMLEEDYLALTKHVTSSTHSVTSRMIKEIILPAIEKEVNEGKNFANLRQIFNSIILSSWYKNNLSQALLNQVYTGQEKVKGIDLQDKNIKTAIYRRYLEAYKKGVFNYIKDTEIADGTFIPRKYFSGGVVPGAANRAQIATPNEAMGVVRTWIINRLARISWGVNFPKAAKQGSAVVAVPAGNMPPARTEEQERVSRKVTRFYRQTDNEFYKEIINSPLRPLIEEYLLIYKGDENDPNPRLRKLLGQMALKGNFKYDGYYKRMMDAIYISNAAMKVADIPVSILGDNVKSSNHFGDVIRVVDLLKGFLETGVLSEEVRTHVKISGDYHSHFKLTFSGDTKLNSIYTRIRKQLSLQMAGSVNLQGEINGRNRAHILTWLSDLDKFVRLKQAPTEITIAGTSYQVNNLAEALVLREIELHPPVDVPVSPASLTLTRWLARGSKHEGDRPWGTFASDIKPGDEVTIVFKHRRQESFTVQRVSSEGLYVGSEQDFIAFNDVSKIGVLNRVWDWDQEDLIRRMEANASLGRVFVIDGKIVELYRMTDLDFDLSDRYGTSENFKRSGEDAYLGYVGNYLTVLRMDDQGRPLIEKEGQELAAIEIGNPIVSQNAIDTFGEIKLLEEQRASLVPHSFIAALRRSTWQGWFEHPVKAALQYVSPWKPDYLKYLRLEDGLRKLDEDLKSLRGLLPEVTIDGVNDKFARITFYDLKWARTLQDLKRSSMVNKLFIHAIEEGGSQDFREIPELDLKDNIPVARSLIVRAKNKSDLDKLLTYIVENFINYEQNQSLVAASYNAAMKALVGYAGEKGKSARIEVYATRKDASWRIARHFADILKERNAKGMWTLFTFPTGNTPIPVYEAFSKMVEAEHIDCSKLMIANMDEYGGADIYREYMLKNLIEKIVRYGFKDGENHLIFDGFAQNPKQELSRYDNTLENMKVKAGGVIYSAFGGIGVRAHLAFNEAPKLVTAKDNLDAILAMDEIPFDWWEKNEFILEGITDIPATMEKILQLRQKGRLFLGKYLQDTILNGIPVNERTDEDIKKINILAGKLKEQPATFRVSGLKDDPAFKQILSRLSLEFGHDVNLIDDEEITKAQSRIVQLTISTVIANIGDANRQFDKMPIWAMTQGMATVLSANEVIVAAVGPAKVPAIKRSLQEMPTAEVPASVVQGEGKVVFILDRESAKGLDLSGFKEVNMTYPALYDLPVALTGATGFLGSAVSRSLDEAGSQARALVWNETEAGKLEQMVPDFEHVQGALDNVSRMKDLVRGKKALIHIAADTRTSIAMNQTDLAADILVSNVLGAGVALLAAEENDDQMRKIFISSFDYTLIKQESPQAEAWIKEKARLISDYIVQYYASDGKLPQNPRDYFRALVEEYASSFKGRPYPLSKFLMDEVLKHLTETRKIKNVLVLRIMGPIGVEMAKSQAFGVLMKMITAILHHEQLEDKHEDPNRRKATPYYGYSASSISVDDIVKVLMELSIVHLPPQASPQARFLELAGERMYWTDVKTGEGKAKPNYLSIVQNTAATLGVPTDYQHRNIAIQYPTQIANVEAAPDLEPLAQLLGHPIHITPLKQVIEDMTRAVFEAKIDALIDPIEQLFSEDIKPGQVIRFRTLMRQFLKRQIFERDLLANMMETLTMPVLAYRIVAMAKEGQDQLPLVQTRLAREDGEDAGNAAMLGAYTEENIDRYLSEAVAGIEASLGKKNISHLELNEAVQLFVSRVNEIVYRRFTSEAEAKIHRDFALPRSEKDLQMIRWAIFNKGFFVAPVQFPDQIKLIVYKIYDVKRYKTRQGIKTFLILKDAGPESGAEILGEAFTIIPDQIFAYNYSAEEQNVKEAVIQIMNQRRGQSEQDHLVYDFLKKAVNGQRSGDVLHEMIMDAMIESKVIFFLEMMRARMSESIDGIPEYIRKASHQAPIKPTYLGNIFQAESLLQSIIQGPTWYAISLFIKNGFGYMLKDQDGHSQHVEDFLKDSDESRARAYFTQAYKFLTSVDPQKAPEPEKFEPQAKPHYQELAAKILGPNAAMGVAAAQSQRRESMGGIIRYYRPKLLGLAPDVQMASNDAIRQMLTSINAHVRSRGAKPLDIYTFANKRFDKRTDEEKFITALLTELQAVPRKGFELREQIRPGYKKAWVIISGAASLEGTLRNIYIRDLPAVRPGLNGISHPQAASQIILRRSRPSKESFRSIKSADFWKAYAHFNSLNNVFTSAVGSFRRTSMLHIPIGFISKFIATHHAVQGGFREGSFPELFSGDIERINDLIGVMSYILAHTSQYVDHNKVLTQVPNDEVPIFIKNMSKSLFDQDERERKAARRILEDEGVYKLQENHLEYLRRGAVLALYDRWKEKSEYISKEERKQILYVLGLKLNSEGKIEKRAPLNMAWAHQSQHDGFPIKFLPIPMKDADGPIQTFLVQHDVTREGVSAIIRYFREKGIGSEIPILRKRVPRIKGKFLPFLVIKNKAVLEKGDLIGFRLRPGQLAGNAAMGTEQMDQFFESDAFQKRLSAFATKVSQNSADPNAILDLITTFERNTLRQAASRNVGIEDKEYFKKKIRESENKILVSYSYLIIEDDKGRLSLGLVQVERRYGIGDKSKIAFFIYLMATKAQGFDLNDEFMRLSPSLEIIFLDYFETVAQDHIRPFLTPKFDLPSMHYFLTRPPIGYEWIEAGATAALRKYIKVLRKRSDLTFGHKITDIQRVGYALAYDDALVRMYQEGSFVQSLPHQEGLVLSHLYAIARGRDPFLSLAQFLEVAASGRHGDLKSVMAKAGLPVGDELLAKIQKLNDDNIRGEFEKYYENLAGQEPEGFTANIPELKELQDSLPGAYLNSPTSPAMGVAEAHTDYGGIDLNTRGMAWTDRKDGVGVEMKVDQAMVARVRREGIDRLDLEIYSITPVTSIWPLIGLNPAAH